MSSPEQELDERPLFSVVMPSFNASEYIGAAIESVLAQSCSDWELLIVDDASNDDSASLIRAWSERDERIRPFFLDRNQGPAGARNLAISHARGRFIAFLDSDDMWRPQKLERQKELFDESDAALVYSAYEKVGPSGEATGRIIRVPETIDYGRLLNYTVIATVTAAYDTNRVGRVYMPDIAKRQDFGLWLRILRKGGFARGCSEPLAALRKRPGSVSSNKLSAVRYTWRVYRQVEGLGPVRSAYHFAHYVFHALSKSVR